MSKELEEAKQKVAQFQKQCEEYLVVIVQQKREADEQQKSGNLKTAHSLNKHLRKFNELFSIFFFFLVLIGHLFCFHRLDEKVWSRR